MSVKLVGGVLAGIIAVIAGLFGVHNAEVHTAPPHASTTTPASGRANHQTRPETRTAARPSPAATSSTVAKGAAQASGSGGVADHYQGFSINAIPLGDGKVSTSPKVGYVYSCQTSFKSGGAEHAGSWINGDTWDLSKKIAVEGNVDWNSARFSSVFSGSVHDIVGNGLPVNEPTGIFPIQNTDPAYQYDRNPNSILTQDISYALPATPSIAAAPSCVPMGAIGIALDGVAIYNALDASGRDAVAHEVQDSCDGHPQSQGQYHYHGPSPCMPGANQHNALVGWALDGFPITSMYDANGHYYTDADLDACHGTTTPITIDGRTFSYHYVLTQEYPYTVGCFMGAPIHTKSAGATSGAQAQGTTQTTGQSGGKTPPQAAIDACADKLTDSSCSFTTPNGTVSGSCKSTPDGSYACVPN